MRRDEDSLAVLRQDAHGGVAALTDLLDAGRLMGVAVPGNESVRAGLRAIDTFDIASLSADSRVLVAAHRAVSAQLHHMPEQRVRLDDGWNSDSATVAIGAVIDHQRRAESDLQILRTLTDATAAAASGIDRLLRSAYLAIARLSAPTAAGTPPAELPQAVLSGKVPMTVAVEDIRSRVDLFTSCVETVTTGIAGIIEILNRSVQGLDDDPYPVTPVDGPPPADVPSSPAAQTVVAPPTLGPVPEPVPVVHTVSEEASVRTEPDSRSEAAPRTGPAPTEHRTIQAFGVPTSATPDAEPTPRDGDGNGGNDGDGDVPFRLGGGATALGAGVAGLAGTTGATAESGQPPTPPPPPPAASPSPDHTGTGRHRQPTTTPSSAGSTPETSDGDSDGELALAGDQ